MIAQTTQAANENQPEQESAVDIVKKLFEAEKKISPNQSDKKIWEKIQNKYPDEFKKAMAEQEAMKPVMATVETKITIHHPNGQEQIEEKSKCMAEINSITNVMDFHKNRMTQMIFVQPKEPEVQQEPTQVEIQPETKIEEAYDPDKLEERPTSVPEIPQEPVQENTQ